jgi:peptidoglycan/xylan/chitin deacetylase (PgdA/CDA1 family)
MSTGAPSQPNTAPMPGFAGYAARDSGATVADVHAICNRDMHSGYGPPPRGDTSRPVAYPLCAYQQLIASLAAMEHVECVTLGDLCRQPSGGERVRLAIRHDVDGDIVAAERGAEIEAEFGVPASYYFLHTAFYHGRFEGGQFLRHGCMAHVYRRIQSLGHEVGLHTNGLEVYEEFGVDGAQAVAAEIVWMRQVGLEVRGTVGHGSKAAFGAENFEVFKGRAKGRGRTDDMLREPEQITHDGKSAWVHVLDEDVLGLDYEGNDIFWQKQVRVEYGATRTVDGWRWNRRFDRDAPGSLSFCSQEAMLADIARLEPGCCVVLTIHPCYYGYRHRPDAAPTLFLDRKPRIVNEEIGWHTWSPRATVATHEPSDDPRLARQSFAAANDLGMLDVDPALSRERRDASRRVLLLDGGALADPGLVSQSGVGRIIEPLLSADGATAATLTLAHPGMGIARFYGWLEWALGRFKPTDIILGIGTRELAWSMPTLWSQTTGLSAQHPAGVCLVPGKDGQPEVRECSSGWIVRQRTPKVVEAWPGTETPIEQTMATSKLPRLDGVHADAFVGACLERFARRARDADARLFIAMTDDGPAWSDESLLGAYRDRVSGWAESAGVEVIDPAEGYQRLEAEGLAVTRPCGSLSVDAHRILSRSCIQALVD